MFPLHRTHADLHLVDQSGIVSATVEDKLNYLPPFARKHLEARKHSLSP